jgi:prepilin-type N-terminal cleavage/methylation domain-containing protein
MVATARNSKGFSLIELMIALVILLISLLGLLAVLANCISANLCDEIRNTAVTLTAQTAEAIHGLPINDSDVLGDTKGLIHNRVEEDANQDVKGFPKPAQDIRNFRQRYGISWSVIDRNENLKEILISVTYINPQGENNSHSAVIYKHRTL